MYNILSGVGPHVRPARRLGAAPGLPPGRHPLHGPAAEDSHIYLSLYIYIYIFTSLSLYIYIYIYVYNIYIYTY